MTYFTYSFFFPSYPHLILIFIYQTAVLLWMHDLPGRDAIIIRKALSGDTTNVEAATEVICTRTPSQIQIFKQHYYAKFGVHLEHDIELRISGDHKKVNSLFLFFSFDNQVINYQLYHIGCVAGP